MWEEKAGSVLFTAAYAQNLQDLADLIAELQEEKQIVVIATAKELENLLEDNLMLYENVDKKVELLSRYVLMDWKE